jgi:hypothetical protein
MVTAAETDRHIAGRGRAPRGAISGMCMRLVSYARQLGLTNSHVKRSRTATSQSHYLVITDADGNLWSMRISDHRSRCTHARHHFELVTPDGQAGEDWAQDSLAIIAGGGRAWFPVSWSRPKHPAEPRRAKQRRDQ